MIGKEIMLAGRKVIQAPKKGSSLITHRRLGRLCKDCANYIEPRKHCKLIGAVEKPDSYFCSWYGWKGIVNAE